MSFEVGQSLTPTIKPIILDLSENLRELLRSRRYTDYRNEAILKKLGGRCCICGELAEHIASYDYAGATRVERYCNSCVEKTSSRSQ